MSPLGVCTLKPQAELAERGRTQNRGNAGTERVLSPPLVFLISVIHSGPFLSSAFVVSGCETALEVKGIDKFHRGRDITRAEPERQLTVPQAPS